MAAQSASKIVVYAALAGNLLIAITKFAAAFFTGSAAMLSEGVHSLVDTLNELLLLYGMHRADRPPDNTHPFGHGRELYFWSFVVAVLIFAVGAIVSGYQGALHILSPEPIENVTTSFIVLGLSAIFEGTSWTLALREFNRQKGRHGYVEAIQRSKDPTTFTVLVEDSVALAGLAIAAIGIGAAQMFDLPALDGAASLGIALVLAATALFLARESMNLLVGESALPEVRDAILREASADPAIRHVNGVLTTQLGPRKVVAALSAEFEDHLATPDIEACIERLEARIRGASPEVTTLFIKPQTPEAWARRTERIRVNDAPRGEPAQD